MALTNNGKIIIDGIEYSVAACDVSIGSTKRPDSGVTDDGIEHIYYIFNRVRTVNISLPPCNQAQLAKVFNAVQGKTYNLTYFDPIDGEKTITARTDGSQASLYSGVILDGLWIGARFTALQIGGENV